MSVRPQGCIHSAVRIIKSAAFAVALCFASTDDERITAACVPNRLFEVDKTLEKQVLANWSDFDKAYFGGIKGVVVSHSDGFPSQEISFQSQTDRVRLVGAGWTFDSPNKSAAKVHNEKYGFLLEKDVDGAWQIVRLVDRSAESALESLELQNGSIFRSLYCPTWFSEIGLVDLWGRDGFKLLECKLEDGRVRISFQYDAVKEFDSIAESNIVKLSDYIKRGELILDPENGFLPVKTVVDRMTRKSDLTPIRMTTEFFYSHENTFGRFRLPERLVTTTNYSPKLTMQSEATFDWDLSARQSYDDFTLAAFGLPEPPGVRVDTHPLVSVGVAGLFLMAAVLIARTYARRSI